MNAPEVKQRMLGGLWGALTGDALGVPVEFRDRASLRGEPVTDMRAYGTHSQPAGTWSDDSSMLLCTVESLVVRQSLDLRDMASRFIRWVRQNHWTPRGTVFDMGVATARSIERLAQGGPPELAGGADTYDNGNGSLMRILPVALAFAGEHPQEVARKAERVSALTHRHLRSQMACAFYCLFARELLAGTGPAGAFACAVAEWKEIYSPPPFFAERLSFQMLEDGCLAARPEAEIDSSGYVMHTLIASVWCLLTSNTFEETALKAVNLGGDTDTTGTVAGGLAGIVYGLEAIPAHWRQQLARHDEVAALFNQFVK